MPDSQSNSLLLRPITPQDIADRCGVSRITVYRALANDPRVNAETRERILATSQELGYDPSRRKQRKPGTATLQDIADRCKLSRATVSRALRGDQCVNEDTRRLVTETANIIGYSPAVHEGARRLALRRSGQRVPNRVIAFITDSDFYRRMYGMRMLLGIFSGLIPAGYELLISDSSNYYQESRSLSGVISRGEVDGAILLMAIESMETAVRVIHAIPGLDNFPLVTLNYQWDDISSVESDNAVSTRQAIEHLLALGHRHLLHLTFPFLSDSPPQPQSRLQAAQETLAKHGLDPNRHLHLLACDISWLDPVWLQEELAGIGHPKRVSDALAMNERLRCYLRKHPEITAILTLNDIGAIRSWHVLREAGYRLPEDMSIIGCDDTDSLPDIGGHNMLTTAHVPLEGLGRAAAETIINLVTTDTPIAEHRTLPSELVIRGTTAPACKR